MTASRLPQLLGFDPAQMFAQGVRMGEADLAVGCATNQVIGRSAALCLLGLRDSNGKNPFQGITVVAPPTNVWNISDADILNLVLQGITDVRRGQAPQANEVEHVEKVLTLRRSAGLDAESLLTEIGACENQFILVAMAHVYRDPSVPDVNISGRAMVLFAEDIWVPQVERWAPRCIELAKQTDSYVLLEVSETPPIKHALIDRLAAIDDLYPAFFGTEGQVNVGAVLAEHASRWTAMAVSGQMEKALGELAELDIDPEYKMQLEVQLLSRGNDPERTRHSLLAYLATKPEIPPELSVRFGRIAQRSGDAETAMVLFREGLDKVADRALLEAMLQSCGSFTDPNLEERIYERLSTLFPDSPELIDYRHQLLLKLCIASEQDHVRQMASRITFIGIEAELANAFIPPRPDKIRDLVERLGDLPVPERDLALLCCATFTGFDNRKQEAINIALRISTTGKLYRFACRLVIQSLKRIFLEDTLPLDQDHGLVNAFAFARHYVANHPQDPHTREAFTSLFAVSTSGSLGLPIIVSEVVKLAVKGVPIKVEQDQDSPQASTDELKLFLERAKDWLNARGALDVGATRLPTEVIAGDPVALLNALGPMIRLFTHSRDPSDIEPAQLLSFIAASLAQEARDTVIDIGALRMVASRLVMTGRSQRARDLAEQILKLAGPMPARKRLAWGAFADIYHRSRNPIDALVGLSCAFELSQEMKPEVLWWETYTLFRIVRDLGLTHFAWQLLPELQALHSRLPEPSQNDIQLASLELGLRVMDQSSRDISALSQLVLDTQAHYEELRERVDEVLPSVALLAQSIALLEQAGGTASAEVQKLLSQALAGLGTEGAQFIRSVASTHPTIEEAIHLYNRVELARYADDVPGDLIASELAARRVLSSPQEKLSPRDAAAAIELLSDHALDPVAHVRALDAQWPLEFCQRILPDDGAVLMLGLDIEGGLACVSIEAAGVRVSKGVTANASYRRSLAQWSDTYPCRYGLIDRQEGNNEFFVSMEPLNIPLPDVQRVLILGDPDMQQVPFNLMHRNNQFLGNRQAFGYVPSLTWLDSAMRRARVQPGKRKAWISEPGDEVGNSALGAVITRTSATLEKHGFVLDTNGQVPDDLLGSEIAVIAAHGSIGIAGRFFHRVADEGGLVLSPNFLAKSLADTELVILFICSGGRMDSHPYSNTSVGLPKQLLSAGCRTVIASPWPLSPSVTGPWLTVFMREWDQGRSALDATFVANQAVEANFGFVPQYSLAMTVSGDPLLCKHALTT
ncbi:MAG: CHAT domain-containing protein [Lysobacter sp.]|nr:CHAT domain-containing protein [Lysobacter sp.]